MKTTSNKLLSLLLAALLLLSVAPLAAFAEEPAVVASGACGDNVTYTLTADGTLTISGAGPMRDYGQTKVPWQKENVKNAVIEEGVTSIGSNVLACSKNLTGVQLPQTIKEYPDFCFYGCEALTDITIADGVESIGMSAFCGCKSLKTVFIPASVTKITIDPNEALFGNCKALEKITVDENNPVYKSDDAGALYTENEFIHLPASGPVTDYTIPNGIVELDAGAFLQTSEYLSVLRIPASVKIIHQEGFMHIQSLKDIYYNGTEAAWADIAFLVYSEDWDWSLVYSEDEDDIAEIEAYYPYLNFGYPTDAFNASNYNLHFTGSEHGWDNGVITKKATPTANGVKTYTCAVCENTKTETIAKASKVTLSKTKFVYNGKVQKPTLTVKDSAGKTISSKYYTAAWSNASSKAVGKYTVTVTFKGIYSGKKALTYTIVPKQVTGLKKTASTTKSIKLSWAKATGAKYYQVYAYSAGAWRYVKTVSVNSATVTKINGNALAAGKSYYFRVRALDESKKCVGAFSATLKTGTRTAAPKVTALTSPKAKTVKVTWGKVTGAKSYVVYKSLDGKKWTKSGTTTGTSFTLTKLTGGKPVYVKVRAVNAYKACSAFSAVKKITVKK